VNPRTFIDDRTGSPVRRWRVMDEWISCLDRFERGQFLDRVSVVSARLLDGPLEADAWARAADLDDEMLSRLLDEVGPFLTELWDESSTATVVERRHDLSGAFLPVLRDPFARPAWWPLEPTREDGIWMQRRDRIVRLFAEMIPEEQAEVLAATFEELRRERSWAPAVRRFLETGEVTIDTVYFVVPLLEHELISFDHTDAAWEDLA